MSVGLGFRFILQPLRLALCVRPRQNRKGRLMKLETFCMDCGEARANFTVAETPCIYEGEGHEWFTVDVTDYAEEVETATRTARLVAFDGCHKIYLAMDEGQASWFLGRDDYETVTGTPAEMNAQVWEWFGRSCCLRFIETCVSVGADPNEARHEQIVPQGAM